MSWSLLPLLDSIHASYLFKKSDLKDSVLYSQNLVLLSLSLAFYYTSSVIYQDS